MTVVLPVSFYFYFQSVSSVTNCSVPSRFLFPPTSLLIPIILEEFHSSPNGGHSGFLQSYKRMAENIYWIGMNSMIQEFVKSFDVFPHQNIKLPPHMNYFNLCPSLGNFGRILLMISLLIFLSIRGMMQYWWWWW